MVVDAVVPWLRANGIDPDAVLFALVVATLIIIVRAAVIAGEKDGVR